MCEDRCYSDFLGLQQVLHNGSLQSINLQPKKKEGPKNQLASLKEVDSERVSEIESIIDEKEECIAGCFKARKGNTDSIYCIERCNEATNARLKKLVAVFGQALESMV